MTEPTKTPVDAFLDDVAEKQASRKEQELAWIQRWQQSEDPEHLEPLLKAYTPIMETALRKYVPKTVQMEGARAQAKKITINALKGYDASRGAAPATHVTNQLQKLQRYANVNQNFGYMPEGQTGQIGNIQRVQERLREDFGRDPTHAEIGQALKKPLSAKRVAQIIGNQRRDIRASAFEDDPDSNALSQNQQVLSLLPYSLDEAEKEVFEHLYGMNGREKIVSTSELARKLNKSPSQISRSKTKIVETYKRYAK